ncbi:GNAT family N-acetyltransferase [Haloplasma contractile]|uniref:Phospholipiddiacylglycerol acyltransferase protein n=1 Tax=Haloplasma contractile SSD-17B TaxID=1033810 RepID=F7PRG1_9MOLU|nr:GNAT family N-acetyltransferase [Haloplasma contractile]ERJ11712.1 phospholipiddiacylglycerol acyltransferase protein [Haloplasma contractile SSD-17B]
MNETVTIRKARKDDAEEILKLVDQVFGESTNFPNTPEEFDITVEQEEEYIEKMSLFLVAVIDDRMIGSLTLDKGPYKKSHHTALLGITILEGYTSMKIGSKMLEDTIKWCKENGIKKINLEVFETNLRAIGLYRKFGFIEEGRRQKEYKVNEQYIDNILMAKFL